MSKTETRTTQTTPAPSPVVSTVSDLLPEPVKRRGISEATWRTLCNSIYPGAQSESILMAVDYCIARNLDVLKRPVHIVPMSVKDAKTGAKAWRDVIMPGIAELRTTAMRTGDYCGQDRPVFGPDVPVETLACGKAGFLVPSWCEVTVHRLVKDSKASFTAIVYFDEAMGMTSENVLNSMWSKRPRGQLQKCAEALALRMGFPEETGGQIAAEEILGATVDAPTREPAKSGAATLLQQLAAQQPVPATFDADASRAADAELARMEGGSDE